MPGAPGSTPVSSTASSTPRPSKSGKRARKAAAPVSFLGRRPWKGNGSSAAAAMTGGGGRRQRRRARPERGRRLRGGGGVGSEGAERARPGLGACAVPAPPPSPGKRTLQLNRPIERRGGLALRAGAGGDSRWRQSIRGAACATRRKLGRGRGGEGSRLVMEAVASPGRAGVEGCLPSRLPRGRDGCGLPRGSVPPQGCCPADGVCPPSGTAEGARGCGKSSQRETEPMCKRLLTIFIFFFPFKFNFFVDCNVSRGSLMLVELLSKEEKKPQTYKDYLKVVANSR